MTGNRSPWAKMGEPGPPSSSHNDRRHRKSFQDTRQVKAKTGDGTGGPEARLSPRVCDWYHRTQGSGSVCRLSTLHPVQPRLSDRPSEPDPQPRTEGTGGSPGRQVARPLTERSPPKGLSDRQTAHRRGSEPSGTWGSHWRSCQGAAGGTRGQRRRRADTDETT